MFAPKARRRNQDAGEHGRAGRGDRAPEPGGDQRDGHEHAELRLEGEQAEQRAGDDRAAWARRRPPSINAPERKPLLAGNHRDAGRGAPSAPASRGQSRHRPPIAAQR